MIFAGPALNLGHPARSVVTGFGSSAYLVIDFDELPQPAAQIKGKPVFVTEQDTYPVRVGDPELDSVIVMHPEREEVALPVAQRASHPATRKGLRIARRGKCAPGLESLDLPIIGRARNSHPDRRS